MKRHWLGGLCLAAALALGCGPSIPRPYLETKAAGHRAYGSGRYDEAAQHFHKAAEHAERIKDRDEALYLEAASYLRSGRHREARQAYEALLEVSPEGARAARSAYEIAQLELEKGDEAKGWKMIHDFVFRFPKSGLARRALLRYLVHLDEEQGEKATIAYVARNLSWFDAHELGEVATYQKALRQEHVGREREARDTFVACARKYPYPYGGLFDDAFYRASILDEKLGEPANAIEHLEEMLRVREVATMHGSYERPRFSEAQMRIGELYRDELQQPDKARRAFRKLFDAFETSLLRDDALWAEAKLAAKQGDQEGTCDAVTLLVEELPDSRYAPCARLLCEDAPLPSGKRSCRAYIARELK